MLPRKRVTAHPGEIVRTEFLEPLNITQRELARRIGVSPYMVGKIANGKRNVSPRIAVMLSQAVGTSPEFWMDLQTDYDLTKLMHTRDWKRIQKITLFVQKSKAVRT